MLEKLKNQKILVIGGAGFIGSNLCQKLVAENNVTSLDNYFTGDETNHIANVEYFIGEAKDSLLIFNEAEFDYIFHFGEYSRVEKSFAEIETSYLNNIASMLPVIQLAKRCSAKLIYSASSTKFYDGTQEERSLSPYSLSKEVNTRLLINFANWFSLRYAVVYFYNVYGPNEISNGEYATVIAKYLRLVREGLTSLPVTKPGSQTRNFTHVSDICDGLELVALHGEGDHYGLGADEGWSILELVEFLGCRAILTDGVPGNRMSAKLVTAKTKKLGWYPKNKLQDYLRDQTVSE